MKSIQPLLALIGLSRKAEGHDPTHELDLPRAVHLTANRCMIFFAATKAHSTHTHTASEVRDSQVHTCTKTHTHAHTKRHTGRPEHHLHEQKPCVQVLCTRRGDFVHTVEPRAHSICRTCDLHRCDDVIYLSLMYNGYVVGGNALQLPSEGWATKQLRRHTHTHTYIYVHM